MSSVTVPLPVEELAVLRGRRSAKWRTYPADVLPLTISETDFPIAEPVAEVLRGGEPVRHGVRDARAGSG